MIGYHYSIKKLVIGDIITSHQGSASRWKFAWPIYKEVASQLGIDFPVDYGYAYPARQTDRNCYCYQVETQEVIPGNCQYSLYYLLGCRIKDPVEIHIWAKKYFEAISESLEEKIEIISPSWKIIKPLND